MLGSSSDMLRRQAQERKRVISFCPDNHSRPRDSWPLVMDAHAMIMARRRRIAANNGRADLDLSFSMDGNGECRKAAGPRDLEATQARYDSVGVFLEVYGGLSSGPSSTAHVPLTSRLTSCPTRRRSRKLQIRKQLPSAQASGVLADPGLAGVLKSFHASFHRHSPLLTLAVFELVPCYDALHPLSCFAASLLLPSSSAASPLAPPSSRTVPPLPPVSPVCRNTSAHILAILLAHLPPRIVGPLTSFMDSRLLPFSRSLSLSLGFARAATMNEDVHADGSGRDAR